MSNKDKCYSLDDLLDEMTGDERRQYEAEYLVLSWTQRLRREIASRGLSFRKLAKMIGTSQSHISRIFKVGNEHKVTLATLARICDALDLTMEIKFSDKRAMTAQRKAAVKYERIASMDKSSPTSAFVRDIVFDCAVALNSVSTSTTKYPGSLN